MSIAALIADLVAAGVAPDLVGRVAAALADVGPQRSARQERNRRYYEKKASEKRLKATEQDVSDAVKTVSDACETQEGAASRACVVIPLEGKKDTLPTHPSDATVPMPKKARKPVPDGWPEDAFDRWWAVYPRRVAKGDAEKAFVAAAKRGDTTFDGIMAATHRFARPPPDPQFTPYPATWLNGKRYLDEQAGPGLFERPRGSARDPTGHAAYLALLDPRPADDGGFGRGPVVDHWPPDRH